MAGQWVQTKFFEFDQNNSGGVFDRDDEAGIGPRVWIEALDANHANQRAETIGLYFDGCEDGRDCECCGDRWYAASGSGQDAPKISRQWDFNWGDTVYVHHLDGRIDRVGKPSETEAA